MMVRWIGCGMLAGFGFLLVLASLETWCARASGPRTVARTGGTDEASDQVWAVLAEARKILEQGA